MSWTKGYKAFDPIRWKLKAGKCRGMLYEEGKTYTLEGELVICKNGFHACKDLVLCKQYYNLQDSVVAEVELLGDVVYEEPTKHKGATNKIKIVRFLSREEVNEVIRVSNGYNSGGYNSGQHNSGDYNSGHRNSGDYNSGHRNSGNFNSGDSNSGKYNSGNSNSGNCNSGNSNLGDCNSGNSNLGISNSGYYNDGHSNSGSYNRGNRNSGDHNLGDYNSGIFNSITPKTINVFNRPADRESALKALDKIRPTVNRLREFIRYEEITLTEAWAKAIAEAPDSQIKAIKAIPNFDAEVFFEITGVNL